MENVTLRVISLFLKQTGELPPLISRNIVVAYTPRGNINPNCTPSSLTQHVNSFGLATILRYEP